jgi:hypothetical protein
MAVALVQKASGTGTTVVLGTAPTPGNIVTITVADVGLLAGITVLDSNLVPLTQRQLQSAAAVSCAVYDYTVTGTPTGTYTIAVSVTRSAAYEVSGAALASSTYSGNFAAASGTTLVSTLPGVLNGDLQVTGFAQGGSSSFPTATFSNGTASTDTQNTNGVISHGLATATASSTSTIGTIASGQQAAMTYATYTAGGGGGGVTAGLYPFEGVYPGGMPGMT